MPTLLCRDTHGEGTIAQELKQMRCGTLCGYTCIDAGPMESERVLGERRVRAGAWREEAVDGATSRSTALLNLQVL
eukprot:1909355-Amphidinium_carterae.1